MTTGSGLKTPARRTGVTTAKTRSSPTLLADRGNGAAASGSQLEPVTMPEERRTLIARSAYLRAERRMFQSSPEQDWLEAEAEFDTRHHGPGSLPERSEQVDP